MVLSLFGHPARDGRPLIMTTNISARALAAIDDPSARLRSDPLLVRLFDLCEMVSYETDAEVTARKLAEEERRRSERSRFVGHTS